MKVVKLEKKLHELCRRFYKFEKLLTISTFHGSKGLLQICKRIRYDIYYKFQCYTGNDQDFETELEIEPLNLSIFDYYIFLYYFQKNLNELLAMTDLGLPILIKKRISDIYKIWNQLMRSTFNNFSY